LRAGKLENAARQAQRAQTLTQERGERGLEAWALWLLGEVGSRQQAVDVATAAEFYRQAMVLGDELGMRPLVAHCHTGLGRLSQRVGKAQEAQGHLTDATEIYRETGMQVSLEQIEAEMRELA